MDKNSVIGFILMGLVLLGFSFYQSNQQKKQIEIQREQRAIAQARQDSLAALEAAAAPLELADKASPAAKDAVPERIYKDASLDAHSKLEGSVLTIENDLIELQVNTKGAQLYSARLKDYSNYGGSDLYILKPGQNSYNVSVYVGQYIQTENFVFDVFSADSQQLVLRLPCDNGGYIEQRYSLEEGSYLLNSELSFVEMDNIPRNVSSVDMDFNTIIPRMEKGYKNESQYSKINYYFSGEKKSRVVRLPAAVLLHDSPRSEGFCQRRPQGGIPGRGE